MAAMTRSELVAVLAVELGLPRKIINSLLSELVTFAISQTRQAGSFSIPGLGRLVQTYPKARMGRNPQTGAAITIPAKRVVNFHVAEEVNQAVSAARRPKPQPNYSVLRIFYATDRELKSADPPRYGPRRNPKGEITLGSCDVSIPRDPRHQTARIERPSIWKFEFRENPDKHIVIRERAIKPAADFYSELSQIVSNSERRQAFIFIHGFRVSFDDAVYRTAQIAYDLGFDGAPILYSWPSNGTLYEYTGDINNNDWTVEHLKVFLRDIAFHSGAEVVHLIAHSMGNRALSNALNLLATQAAAGPKPHFNQIVLTAPDIDAEVFAQLANSIRTMGERVTLYASTRDKALYASMRKNGSYRRAGDLSGAAVVVEGVDTIDASAVDTNLIGHFYYAENRSVLSDIFNLLKDGSPPQLRFGIHKADKIPPYWYFAP
ncbi:MAG TPA: alpha/beta hydrolase [Candidatus Angelobacter sp.]|nr:alpha/beta hydrolase [Candidatus Angelobacter sp.]